MDIKVNLVAQKIFYSDLVAIYKIKTTFTLTKPAYARMCILELSKKPKYELHFDYIKNKYGNKLRLLFRYSDSLVYEIETKSVYDDFSKNLILTILLIKTLQSFKGISFS